MSKKTSYRAEAQLKKNIRFAKPLISRCYYSEQSVTGNKRLVRSDYPERDQFRQDHSDGAPQAYQEFIRVFHVFSQIRFATKKNGMQVATDTGSVPHRLYTRMNAGAGKLPQTGNNSAFPMAKRTRLFTQENGFLL